MKNFFELYVLPFTKSEHSFGGRYFDSCTQELRGKQQQKSPTYGCSDKIVENWNGNTILFGSKKIYVVKKF